MVNGEIGDFGPIGKLKNPAIIQIFARQKTNPASQPNSVNPTTIATAPTVIAVRIIATMPTAM